MNPRIPDARIDGRLLGLRNNGPLVHVSQITIAPFEEEDDIEVPVGDFSREALIAALNVLDTATGAIPVLHPDPPKSAGVGTPRRRFWRR